MDEQPPVREMRFVVTTTDYADAVRFYRDVLGLPERVSYSSSDGQVLWQDVNARLEAPGGLQLTLFSEAPPSQG